MSSSGFGRMAPSIMQYALPYLSYKDVFYDDFAEVETLLKWGLNPKRCERRNFSTLGLDRDLGLGH